MNIVRDDDKYDDSQEVVLENIVKSFKQILEQNGVDEEMIYSIAGDLAFDVCAIIDGSAEMGTEKNPVLPFLAFKKSEEETNTLIVNNIGSYMHEMTYGIVDKVFEIDQE
jgi:hypothetical protein